MGRLFVANAEAQMGHMLGQDAVSERYLFDRSSARGGRTPFSQAGRSITGGLGFFKNMAQGACAGLLTLLGATHLTGAMQVGAAKPELLAASIDPTTLQGLAAVFLSGSIPGIMEIMGAIALFLNAGNGMGRIVGLLTFVAIAVAHANGVSPDEFLQSVTQVSDVVSRLVANFGGVV